MCAQMLLQSKQMQLDTLELRTQAAMMRNRMVRFDNPLLRTKMADVAARRDAAARVQLPAPVDMPPLV